MDKVCYWSGLPCDCAGGACRDPFFDDPDFLDDGGVEALDVAVRREVIDED